jgi:hypothetical protein
MALQMWQGCDVAAAELQDLINRVGNCKVYVKVCHWKEEGGLPCAADGATVDALSVPQTPFENGRAKMDEEIKTAKKAKYP